MKRLVNLLLGVIVLGAIYWSIDLQAFVNVFARCDVGLLAAALSMFVPTTLCTAWRLTILTPPPAHIRLGEAVRFTLVAASLNLVLPSKAGDIVKGVFIAKRGHLSTPRALGLTTYEKACDLLALLGWCVVGLGLIDDRSPAVWAMGAVVVVGLCTGLLALATSFFDALMLWGAKWLPAAAVARQLRRLSEGWAEVRRANSRRPGRALAVAGLSIGIWFLHLLQIWLFIAALRGGVPLLDSLALTPLAILVGLLPLTMAGIGTRDAALIYFYGRYFDAATGAALGLLCTLRYVLPAIAGLPWLRAGWALSMEATEGQPDSGHGTTEGTPSSSATAESG